MSRAVVSLINQEERKKAAKWSMTAPFGTRVEFKERKRTIPQNDKMWAALTDIARQVDWHGERLSPDDWKVLFLDALSRESRSVPSIDGSGFVDLGRSSSKLSKSEMINLIELIHMFGANHNVKFGDENV